MIFIPSDALRTALSFLIAGLAVLLVAMGCASTHAASPGPCEAKRDLYTNCRKQQISDAQVADCKSTLPSRNCSGSDLDAYAAYGECMSDQCSGGKSERDADAVCFEKLNNTSTSCQGP